MDRERAALPKPDVDVGETQPEQAVAATQVMIEERERRAGGEGVQPERDLGQLDRHRVLVHAVHDALQDHAADKMLVVQLCLVDSPTTAGSEPENAIADRGDALDQWRFIGMLVVGERHEPGCRRDRLEHAVGKEIDQ